MFDQGVLIKSWTDLLARPFGCSVESVMGGPSLGSKRLPGKQTQTEKGVNNANSRRSRAFRAALVRAVALLHDRFLQQLRDATAGSTADGGHLKAKVCHSEHHLDQGDKSPLKLPGGKLWLL